MQKFIQLSDGNQIPSVGLGTWKAEKNQVGDAIQFALLEAEYRHIDCAKMYGNEQEIGEALTSVFGKSLKREDVFITSKVWNTDHKPEDVEKSFRKTLVDLRLDYLDLYLMHWGIAFQPGDTTEPLDNEGKVILEPVSIQETWRAMEGLVKKGLIKSIGVANFSTMMLLDLLASAEIKPVMNQIELHPYNAQEELVNFCQTKNVAVTAYAPLGRTRLFDEPIIVALSAKYKKSPAQIILHWGLKRGTVVIPKSIQQVRLAENIAVFDFALTDEDQAQISTLNKNYRLVNPSESWGVPYFS